jgi:DHA2 family multidrug resistance protein-like MFS transporter
MNKATRREWVGLAVLALPCFVYAMDLTVLNLAVPAISAELRPSTSQLLWIIDIYGFLVAGFLITMGTLGDRIGRRKLLMYGAAAFCVASIVAAFADTAATLIAMRALLGVAGATLAPSTMSLIRNMFHDEQERQFAIGVWIASFSIGGAIGPLVGGVMLEYFWWGSVFLVAVPVMVLVLAVGPKLLPEYRDPAAGELDLVSVGQSLFAVLATIYGLKQLAEFGPQPAALISLLIGIVLGVLFVRRQRRIAYPLLDVRLFRQARFSAVLTAYALSCLAMYGVYIFITQYLQLVLGLSPLLAGLATIPWGVSFIVGSLLAPRLARRFGPARVLVWGLAVSTVGFGLLMFVSGDFGLPWLIANQIVMSVGLAPVYTIGNEIIITAAPPERAGAASALSETSAEFSGAIGIAAFGSLGAVVYRQSLLPELPAAVSEPARSDALATLGGAIDAGRSLAGPDGDALVLAARNAFVDAFQVTALLGTAIVLVSCVLVARMLRDKAPAA